MKIKTGIIILFLISISLPMNSCLVIKTGGGSDMEGTWVSEDSSFKLEIDIRGKKAKLKSWDLDDNEAFEISEVDWNGTVLKARFRMPSTNWVTYSEFHLVDKNTLHEHFTGDSEGEVTYTRQ